MKETEFKLEFVNFHCPVTGKHVLDPAQFNPFPAMVFLFFYIKKEVLNICGRYTGKIFRTFNDELKHGELYLLLTEKEFINKENYWWITHGEPPFGLVSMCFDMEYEEDNEAKEHPFYLEDSKQDDFK